MPRHSVLAALFGTAAAIAPSAAQQPAAQVAVAARTLPRGAVLGESDIAWVSALDDRGRLRVLAPGDAIGPGWVTRRVVAAGEPLRAPAVVPPRAVRAGEAVTLVVRRGDVQLSLPGTATRDAGIGERVTVRVDARRRFEGVVESPGHVHLP